MTGVETNWSELADLLRGREAVLRRWTMAAGPGQRLLCLFVLAAGCGAFGAAVGSWRDPLQAGFTALKLPLVVFLTMLGNALLNGMLAPLLGLNLSFRQTFQLILICQTLLALILGSFSPLAGFMVWNTPPLGAIGTAGSHSLLLLGLVCAIAFAGVAAHWRLYRFLNGLAPGSPAGRRVFWAWLGANLFLGTQIAWVLRPFVGSPGLPVAFLRPDALKGSFLESVWYALQHL
jgi:hypothetical protein